MTKRRSKTRENDDDYRELVARGVLRPARASLDWKRIDRLPTVEVPGNAALDALLRDREEARY